MWPCAWTTARPCRPRRPRSPTPFAGRSRWAARCKAAHARSRSGTLRDRAGGPARRPARPVRRRPAALWTSTATPSAASASAKDRELVRQALAVTTHLLPADQPRYLMGVGRPQDIVDAVATGIDLFDCVMPTRNGRNATCFSDKGYVKLRNAVHRLDPRPIEEGCDCLACRRFSRSYLRHLFLAKEMLGPDPGVDPQPDVSASADFPDSRGDRGGSVCPVPFRSP